MSLGDYHGTPLEKEEIDVLNKFEENLGERIPNLENEELGMVGFTSRDNHVEILIIQDYELVSLPETIGNLTHLEELIVYRTQITSLPESIVNLESIKMLALRYNKLLSLPTDIGQLKKLET